MKTTTVREVQHNLSKILRWVEDGEQVIITRHRRAIANLVPSASPNSRRKPEWPDFARRIQTIWGTSKGKPVSRIIVDERNERP